MLWLVLDWVVGGVVCVGCIVLVGISGVRF